MSASHIMPGLAAVVRAVIYTRVSYDKRKQARSVEEQEQEGREACDLEGWSFVRVFSDNDKSASRFARKERKDYAALLQFLRTDQADVLVMWEPSRGDRELERWVQLLKLCRDRSILIHIVSHEQTYDVRKPKDFKQLANEGVDAAYESERTSQRVRRSTRQAASAGRPHGRPLFGYRRVYDVDTGEMIGQAIDEEKAAIVREAAKRVAAGEACYSVAEDFNRRGIATPARGTSGWDLTQVKRMVLTVAYIGQRVHRGKVVGPGDWKPILDADVYAVCEKRLTDPARRTNRDTTVKHLLSGAGRCGVCETPTSYSKIRAQKNRSYQTYVCVEKFCTAIKTTWLDEYVADVIVERLSRTDAIEVLIKPKHQADVEAHLAQQEYDEKKALLDSWYAAAAAGKITPDGLAAIEAQLVPQIEAADRKRKSSVISPLLLELAEAGPNARAVWDGWNIAKQREAVTLLMIVRIMRTTRGARRFDPARVAIQWHHEELADRPS